jgi:hypothetical protein
MDRRWRVEGRTVVLQLVGVRKQEDRFSSEHAGIDLPCQVHLVRGTQAMVSAQCLDVRPVSGQASCWKEGLVNLQSQLFSCGPPSLRFQLSLQETEFS